MPLLNPESVVSYLIADERIKDHLRRAEHQRARVGFRDYAAKFGIHDLGEVSKSQLFALVAARNTAPIVDLLRIPRGRDLASASAYATYDLHRPKTSLGPAVQSYLASVPNNEQEWEVLRDPEDIPQAIPEDLLLRRLAPKEFLRRLTEGELIRSAWIQEDFDETLNNPVEVPDEETRYDQVASPEDGRPFGYLLLDASESMGSGRDRRDEVARGLSLAYLLSQYEAGNPTVLYLFRHELSSEFGGETRRAFENAVAATLAHSHEGMTNLQGALKLLAGAMKSRSARIDIALITDGITRLTENPVPDCHLHTFFVGARPEEFDKVGGEQYQESFLKLQSWSESLFKINPEVMDSATVPRREDVLDFSRIMYGLRDEFAGAASADKIRRLQNRLANYIHALERYRKYHGTEDDEVERLWKEAQTTQTELGTADPIEISMKNAAHWTPIDRELTLALETRELRSLIDQPENLEAKWTLKVVPETFVSPWRAMIMLIESLIARARAKVRLRTRLRKALETAKKARSKP